MHGVQRDDVLIEFNTGEGMRAAKLAASQGQTRSLVLALKLAAVKFVEQQTGEAPIVLLDDIESELDQRRRGALFGLIRSSTSQVLLTTTDLSPELSENLPRAQVLRIVAGGLVQVAKSTP
jgi:DNA replication and repair protein RecF